MFSQVRQQTRQRQLAGDGRAGSWASAKARRRHWQFIRNGWGFIVGTATGAAAAISIALVVVRAEFLRGVIVGALTVGTIGALAMLVILMTGTGPTSMGATAERRTAGELRALKRAGWRVVNHFPMRAWDIDHVLVGPGGVIAVETKWSANGWTLDRPNERLNRAIDQVSGNAKSLRLWHDLRSLGIESVIPVVFLWGRNGEGSYSAHAEPCTIAGVTVIHGFEAARSWRATIESQPFARTYDASEVQRMWDVLDRQVQRRDSHEEANSPPPPPTLTHIYWTAVSVAAAALGSVIGTLQALQLSNWWAWSAAVLVAAIAGMYVRRVRAMRLAAVGWLAGLGGAALLVGVIELLHAVGG